MQQPLARLSLSLIYSSTRPFCPLRGSVIRTGRRYSTEIPPRPPTAPGSRLKEEWSVVFIIAGLTALGGYVFVKNDAVLGYRLDQLSQKIMGRPDEKQLFEERRRLEEEAIRQLTESSTKKTV
ncbi:hypothetical protein I307_02696 [Cryptococcus deuterogattii 99/473]|uniref:Unplaced genomic scaffold supercont1.10, whole genome shotgun sequence n=1 Tax=Cryptococcus deuterogattii Ram5 TaxID=1296110 RepID=A0A0D0TUX4_9TREE|nr:hypothetical protein I313_04164 [Cryptococcus deuterogattii Ram5]KIY58020.1 hypothetical protein I307_02696 [Cryptococcus deuterogattii 99/473]